MKKILLGLMLLLPIPSLANEPIIIEKSVPCAKSKDIIETLIQDYKEMPMWSGNDTKTKYGLFVSKNGAWTLIQFNDEVACILGAGENSAEIFSSLKS